MHFSCTYTHCLGLANEESRTSGHLMPKCLQVRVCQSWSNITWIEPEYLTKSNPPILDSLSNDSKRSSSKWSRYMAERPKATSLPVTQLRWITSVTGSLIPLLLLNYCNKIRVKYRVSHTSPIGAQFRCSPTFPAGWPDLDPHAADRRCSQVSECTQNTLLRFLLDEESRTSGRLVPKCLQVRVCQSWSNIT